MHDDIDLSSLSKRAFVHCVSDFVTVVSAQDARTPTFSQLYTRANESPLDIKGLTATPRATLRMRPSFPPTFKAVHIRLHSRFPLSNPPT